MTPTNNLSTEAEEVDDDDMAEMKRHNPGPVTRAPVQRTKRIRTQRRNTANGIQRRRNKRINW